LTGKVQSGPKYKEYKKELGLLISKCQAYACPCLSNENFMLWATKNNKRNAKNSTGICRSPLLTN